MAKLLYGWGRKRYASLFLLVLPILLVASEFSLANKSPHFSFQ